MGFSTHCGGYYGFWILLSYICTSRFYMFLVLCFSVLPEKLVLEKIEIIIYL